MSTPRTLDEQESNVERQRSSSRDPLLPSSGPTRKYGVNSSSADASPTRTRTTEIPPTALVRGLSARQVQMIALAGTIGTGLFLGTGKSLAEGGPASVLICYTLIGCIVYVVLVLLGEMATQYPVAGSFNAYATRFVDDAFGFAIAWNYWFNDAISVASDLTAAQIVLSYWTSSHLWLISLFFLLFLLSVNAFSVGAYGELEYWLSSLKIATVVLFIVLGVFVNAGLNTQHRWIGLEYWRIEGAPFVNGFGGFAKVFVTASFAYGGTESLGITAGETRNPTKNMPRVVKNVFWRILIFYLLTILIIGLNVPYTYPNLSNRTTTTSPFTIVFAEAGSSVAASFMNTVILSSVLSAGNHALFAGTRVMYSLSQAKQAPKFASRLNRGGVPYASLLLTSSVSGLCFASSFIGNGTLWGWLQNLVGVSNQLAWASIGIASYRFRRAWIAQGRDRAELKFQGAQWTWGWGPQFVVVAVSFLILVQGYSSLRPFDGPEFLSLYMQLPFLLVMFISRKFLARTSLVTIDKVDLYTDEYIDREEDENDIRKTRNREEGRWKWLWKLYHWIA